MPYVALARFCGGKSAKAHSSILLWSHFSDLGQLLHFSANLLKGSAIITPTFYISDISFISPFGSFTLTSSASNVI